MSEYSAAGSTLDLMDFTNVRDNGVVETATTYAMLIRVQPRDWLILSEEQRENLYLAFMTYLRGLQFPTQMLSMTTAYDPEPYLARFQTDTSPVIGPTNDRDGTGKPPDESPLLDYGRRHHSEWLRNVIEVADIRDREFYAAVSVAKPDDNDTDLLSTLRSVLRGNHSSKEGNETACIEEVQARAQRVASKLPQTRVETEILASRSAVLEVLYEVYHGEKPPISFTQGNYTTATTAVEGITDAEMSDSVRVDALDETLTEDGDETDTVAKTADETRHTGADSTAIGRRESEKQPVAQASADDGLVHPHFRERVSKDRVLRWYSRNIGPIGYGPRPIVPIAVYLGVILSALSLLVTISAVGAFIWSMGLGTSGGGPHWTARTSAFEMGLASVPLLLLSLVVLFPTNLLTELLGLGGVAVTGAATKRFIEVYPQWSLSNTTQTMAFVEVYAAGALVLLVAVGLAVQSRRHLIDRFVESATMPDGGSGAGPKKSPSQVAPESMTNINGDNTNLQRTETGGARK